MVFTTMAKQTVAVKSNSEKILHDLLEETAASDLDDSKKSAQTHGDEGILTTVQRCKMETLTTSRASYVPLMGAGVRLKGIRRELLEKHLTQMIREKIQSELSRPAPEADYRSTTQRDFCVPGFVPSRSKSTQDRDYKSEQAITFWSENCRQIQGVTSIRNPKAPFRKSALFSTPISERLDEEELPPDN